MKKILLLSFFCIQIITGYTQRYADIGIIGGGVQYVGDFTPTSPLHSISYDIGGFYRYSFHYFNALRLSGRYTKLKSTEGNSFLNHFKPDAPRSFNETVLDFALDFELNFLKYRTTDVKNTFAPYLSGGIGVTYGLSKNIFAMNIPFGIGVKQNITKKLSVGAEYTLRKSFSDEIDGVTNFGSDLNKNKFVNKDWYSYANVFVSYKFFKFADTCPTYTKY